MDTDGAITVKDNSSTVPSVSIINFTNALVEDAGDNTVDVTLLGGSGEVNTASNIGTGVGVYKQKTGVNLELKSLTVSGTGLTLTNNTNDIQFSLAGPIQGIGALDSSGGYLYQSGASSFQKFTSISAITGGTGITSYVIGDTLYSSGTNALAKLAGNITTTKQYLSQTGNGSQSAAPA